MSAILGASLVLTVLNEERSLPRFLASVSRQRSVPAQIVVVDGGSIDQTVEILRSWSPPAGCTLKLIEKPGATISEGRNCAAALAEHELLLVSDGGATLCETWAQSLADALKAGCDVASGFFYPVGDTPTQRTIGAIITPTLSEIRPNGFLPSSRSLGVRKAAFIAAGGYPEWLDYCEDLVLDLSLRERGFRFDFVPSALVSWDSRPTLRSFAKQYYRYARGDAQARLWPKRHAARFGAYAVGVALIFTAIVHPLALALLIGGLAAHLVKPTRRVLARRELLAGHLSFSIAMVPVVVVIGDVAKMLGYIAGLRRRP